ncbi:hypothetical protein GCM10029976_067380 [Kribbella albertanoniae]|uniref:Uncharacterized protein n=1 Tax=Kribbella albertanoniae TaxID=1266829 RepID=A0A4R4QJ44_9ACTN|nr:hypothetical protein [Kribbella albertanoniae]TDC35841.1 hypothetical protein E1261_00510 [Kribbella albertanoniae]
MRDFTASKAEENSEPDQSGSQLGPADRGFRFNGLSTDDDTAMTVALKNSIAGTLALSGISGISFAEPQEITDARARIQGRESTFRHVTDGTPTGCLCGYTPQKPPARGAPDCPACELLDC